MIQAFQSPNIWALNGTTANSYTTAGVPVSSINTNGGSFNYKVDINTMAWDGTNLWLHGEVDANNRNEFVKVDVAAGTKVDAKPFDVELEAITWDGTHFWAVTGTPISPILKIDPATFTVVATYYPPIAENMTFLDWRGIAAFGGAIYLLGEDQWTDPETAIIVKMTP
jgi:hypothetical protein